MTNFRSFPTGYARRLQACEKRIRYLKFAGFASSEGVLGPSLRQKSAANQLIYRFRRTAPGQSSLFSDVRKRQRNVGQVQGVKQAQHAQLLQASLWGLPFDRIVHNLAHSEGRKRDALHARIE